jgi:uncharacterized protein DUF6335
MAKGKTKTKTRKKATRKSRRAARPARRKVARRKPTTRKAARRKPASRRKRSPRRTITRPRKASRRRPAPETSTVPRPVSRPRLQRERRRLPDAERLDTPLVEIVEPDARILAAARSGREELKADIARHTETGPVLTAGDVDARWQDAYAVGDEAPGGDNPTPDQARVDDIGKALGVQYQDNEELKGGEEIVERDRHRWELDPASSEDWPHEKKKDKT